MNRPFVLILAAFYLAACAAPAAPTPSPTLAPTATQPPTATATATLTPSATPIPLSGLCSPLADHSFQALLGYVAQPFIAPLGGNWDGGHHGMDFAYYTRNDEGGQGGFVEGVPIQSAFDGEVAGSGFASIYGNYVIVETPFERLPAETAALFSLQPGQSLYVLYAHMQQLSDYPVDSAVTCGSVIGHVGASGTEYFVVEPHLHFEVRSAPSGERVADMTYYDTQASEQQKAEYERWRNGQMFQLFDPQPLIELGMEQETHE